MDSNLLETLLLYLDPETTNSLKQASSLMLTTINAFESSQVHKRSKYLTLFDVQDNNHSSMFKKIFKRAYAKKDRDILGALLSSKFYKDNRRSEFVESFMTRFVIVEIYAVETPDDMDMLRFILHYPSADFDAYDLDDFIIPFKKHWSEKSWQGKTKYTAEFYKELYDILSSHPNFSFDRQNFLLLAGASHDVYDKVVESVLKDKRFDPDGTLRFYAFELRGIRPSVILDPKLIVYDSARNYNILLNNSVTMYNGRDVVEALITRKDLNFDAANDAIKNLIDERQMIRIECFMESPEFRKHFTDPWLKKRIISNISSVIAGSPNLLKFLLDTPKDIGLDKNLAMELLREVTGKESAASRDVLFNHPIIKAIIGNKSLEGYKKMFEK